MHFFGDERNVCRLCDDVMKFIKNTGLSLLNIFSSRALGLSSFFILFAVVL